MSTPYGEVYLLTCSTNGKQYVGQTTYGASHRWAQHRQTAKLGRGYIIGKAIRKYGEHVFALKVLDTAATQAELDAKEVYWIAEIGTVAPRGYNLQEGGNGGRPCEETRRRQSAAQTGRVQSESTKEKLRVSSSGRTLSPEARAKISQRHKGRVVSEEGRRRMSLAKKGKPLSPEHAAKARVVGLGRHHSLETCDKLRKINLGRKMSPEAVEKNRKAQTGKKRSPEAVEKTRQAQLGMKRSPEHVEKIRQSNLGRKHTDETRANMSAGAQRRDRTDPASVASIEAMRQANLGRVMTPEQRAQHSARLKGIKRSPEACARMKAAKANITDETRERMRKAAQARPRRTNSPETKEKMRQSAIEAHRARREKTSMISEG